MKAAIFMQSDAAKVCKRPDFIIYAKICTRSYLDAKTVYCSHYVNKLRPDGKMSLTQMRIIARITKLVRSLLLHIFTYDVQF